MTDWTSIRTRPDLPSPGCVRAHFNGQVVVMNQAMGIAELADRSGVAPHTLRYYEKAGLMLSVPRDSARRRVYTEDHLKWVRFLLHLREGGMGIAQIRAYAELLRSDSIQGRQDRLEILRQHRDEVKSRIERLRQHLMVLEQKVAAGCGPDINPPTGKG